MTMKTKNLLWAALSMTAALVMTACSSDDNNMTETPQAPSTSKTIPYTVTVGGDEATTRANIVEPDHRTLYFATGDKLYITGENIQGVLSITDGVGESSGATFSGELTYDGSGSPADNLSLTATLVSEQQEGTNKVSVDDAGAVTVNYPTTAYCTSVNDAVQKYSNLTGTSTYGAKSFTLTQQTAFLNFVITFEDGTTAGTELTAVVNNNNSSDICSASVTTVTDNGVKAKFVLPVASGTVLSSATVTMGSKAALAISDATLTGKVYNVKKTQYKMAAAATSADKGKLICADGHIHAYGADAACTKARVAKIIYIGATGHATYSHGLALALTDEASTMAWQAAIDACSAKNTSTPVTGATWLLASYSQWEYMLGDNGAGSNTALRTGFSGITGADNLQSGYYWLSTEYYSDRAWIYGFVDGDLGNDYKYKDDYIRVRACLAF